MRVSRITVLRGVFGVQAFCACFFVFEALADMIGLEALPGFHRLDSFEFFVAASLIAGMVATGLLIRTMAQRQASLTRQLDVASGAFARVIEEHFNTWGLSASEREVAMMSIKGLSIAEIAAVRQTKEGTVKAQNASVYRKAGVSGRMQLLSLFIDELITEPLVKVAE